jgi:ubiquinone/menaquinone biosynthesis C-methylase UbiE
VVKLPGLGGWSEDPLWGAIYDWTVEHPRAGGVLWRLGIQSDLGRLYEAAEEIGQQADGARILDIPCGGGVALRALRPGQHVEYVAADISQRMLDRTMDAARARGVEHLVTPRLADVGALPFDDASFDLVVSFTGLHCFPDPARAVVEMVRVLRPGGVITGSALFEDTGRRYEPMRRVGRLSGLLGPGCTTDEVCRWLTSRGIEEVTIDVSGAMGYFRGVRVAPRTPPAPGRATRTP